MMSRDTRFIEEPLTISVNEAAKLLAISRSLAYELCARGELPVVRLGRRLVISRRRLLEMIDQDAPAKVGVPHVRDTPQPGRSERRTGRGDRAAG